MRWGILLFFSGAAALVYQTLWVKQLTLVVGVDVYAVAIGVAAFFFGLAFGSSFFGRRADRSPNPGTLFGYLEVGIAAVGMGATIVLSDSAARFVAMQGAVGPLAWVLPFLLVGVPAFLMGGTLPALLKARAPEDFEVSGTAGRYYAVNTAGAIVGVLATVFLLVPSFGVRGTGMMAGTVNLAVGLAAIVISRRRGESPVREAGGPDRLPREARFAVVLYAIAGGIALGYEVVWSQAIVQFLSTRTFAFAVVLATYLLGLVVGANVFARYADKTERPWRVFGVLISAAGVTALLSFTIVGPWLIDLQKAVGSWIFGVTGSRLGLMIGRFVVAAVLLVLPSTLMLGAAFPAAMRIVARANRIGRDSGSVLAWNTAGGILGTLLTGFLLVPVLGLMRTLGALTLASVVVGGVALIRGAEKPARAVGITAGLVLVVGLAMVLTPKEKLGQLLAESRGGRLVFYDESAQGTVAVLEQQSSNNTFRRLYINGTSNSGDAMTSMRYMRLQALLPLLIHHGEPRSALVIGLGTGITTGALLAYPLQIRSCAELIPAVVDAAPTFAGNLEVVADPRVTIHLDDGRHYLLETSRTYDLITLEPPPPSAAGVVNLYSREFYELARDRLNRYGLLAQWWPLPTQNDEESQSLMKSFIDVFPHVSVWTTEVHEMMVIGSMDPIDLDGDKIAERFKMPEVTRVLSQVGVRSTADLLATYVMGRTGLASYVGEALPVTDDRPRIEYAPWVRPREITRVLPRLMALAEVPPIRGSGQLLRDRAESKRDTLFTFYNAILAAYQGDRQSWAELRAKALGEDGDNPYFLWFGGDG